jgi:hypothetical protein
MGLTKHSVSQFSMRLQHQQNPSLSRVFQRLPLPRRSRRTRCAQGRLQAGSPVTSDAGTGTPFASAACRAGTFTVGPGFEFMSKSGGLAAKIILTTCHL